MFCILGHSGVCECVLCGQCLLSSGSVVTQHFQRHRIKPTQWRVALFVCYVTFYVSISTYIYIYIYIYMDTNMQCCVLLFPDSDLEVSVIFYWTLRFGVLLSQHRRILKGGSTSDLLFGKKTNTQTQTSGPYFLSNAHTQRLHLIWQQSWKKYRLTEVYVWQSF